MKPDYMELVEGYLKSKGNSWSSKTAAGALGHLRGLPADVVLSNNGKLIYEHLTTERKLKPYSTKTYMIRVADFLDWAMEEGHVPRAFNNVKLYMRKNARLFKSVYQQNHTGFSFQEVLKRIAQIEDEESREFAAKLLATGLRIDESASLKDGMVVGKGNATRYVPAATKEHEAVRLKKHENTFRYHLKKVGLKPHDLRKAHANFLVENGATLPQLMAMMGWRTVQSAASYLASKGEQEFAEMVKKAMKGGKA